MGCEGKLREVETWMGCEGKLGEVGMGLELEKLRRGNASQG